LIAKFTEYISKEDSRNEVDEIGANLFILIKESVDILEEDESGAHINEFVESVANMNYKKYASLTSKTVFKFMDLSEE
jgi:hypothetical protein